MPVNIFISCIIGSAFGWILVKITRTPPHLQGLVIACSSAGKIIYSPVIVMLKPNKIIFKPAYRG